MTKHQHWVFLTINLFLIGVCGGESHHGKGDKIFAGPWKGTRVQWTDRTPDVYRTVPAKAVAPFEIQVDASERHFAGFNVTSRNGRTISGHRITRAGGYLWQETATLTVAADGMTATFNSKSVMLIRWGTTVENSAELRKVSSF
jgi:hypothetical protein